VLAGFHVIICYAAKHHLVNHDISRNMGTQHREY
jgi:hypothetical protein